MKKFEFVLYINRNIIVQRYFTVKNYNKEVLNSINLYNCLKNVVRLIQDDLKAKSEDYMWKNYNEYEKQEADQIVRENIYENEDVYDFEIKVDDKVVIGTKFTGNVYPQRVRYSVDIRKLIPTIINEIQDTFQEENLDVEYCGIEL
jgi:hypothetical protein